MFNYDSFTIRPVEINDKNRILQWRNSERVSRYMYSDHVISQQEHEIWFTHALDKVNGHHLIFLQEAKAIGLISFKNICNLNGRCYWAFYLGEPDVARGVGAAMEFFALDYAFLNLKIKKLCCEVFKFNAGVIKLHEKFGFAHEGRFVEHYLKNGKYEDIVCMAKFGATWVDERDKFKNRIFRKSGN